MYFIRLHNERVRDRISERKQGSNFFQFSLITKLEKKDDGRIKWVKNERRVRKGKGGSQTKFAKGPKYYRHALNIEYFF